MIWFTGRSICIITFGILVISVLATAVPAPVPSALFETTIGGLYGAEIAPDDVHLAALVFPVIRGGAVPVEIQIWNIRERKLVQARRIEVELPGVKGAPGAVMPAIYIRYSADGLLLAVYAGGETVHVFRAIDLLEINQIQLKLNSGELSGFEISPTSHLLATRRALSGTCCSSKHRGEVRIYDLDSGRDLRSWTIDKAYMSPTHGPEVAWRSDGGLFAVVAPDGPPCTRFGGTIYVFDPSSEEHVSHFGMGFLPGSIAFGSNDKLYVASMTCGGYFAHRTTDLSIFDARNGRKIGKIPAAQVGIRDRISISNDRRILLAYADREKMTFEGFEDTLKISDARWQVLDLSTGHLRFTIPATRFDKSSLSMSGRFLLNLNTTQIRIFSVPSD